MYILHSSNDKIIINISAMASSCTQKTTTFNSVYALRIRKKKKKNIYEVKVFRGAGARCEEFVLHIFRAMSYVAKF